MSTPIQFQVKNEQQLTQFLSEIRWIEGQIRIVKPLLERKPSKIRHLRDLERQRNERISSIEKYLPWMSQRLKEYTSCGSPLNTLITWN